MLWSPLRSGRLSPEEIETTVTAPIRQAMASVSFNVDEISSISQENSSMVVLKFVEDADMDACVTDMREMLDLIESVLPEEAGNPYDPKAKSQHDAHYGCIRFRKRANDQPIQRIY